MLNTDSSTGNDSFSASSSPSARKSRTAGLGKSVVAIISQAEIHVQLAMELNSTDDGGGRETCVSIICLLKICHFKSMSSGVSRREIEYSSLRNEHHYFSLQFDALKRAYRKKQNSFPSINFFLKGHLILTKGHEACMNQDAEAQTFLRLKCSTIKLK